MSGYIFSFKKVFGQDGEKIGYLFFQAAIAAADTSPAIIPASCRESPGLGGRFVTGVPGVCGVESGFSDETVTEYRICAMNPLGS